MRVEPFAVPRVPLAPLLYARCLSGLFYEYYSALNSATAAESEAAPAGGCYEIAGEIVAASEVAVAVSGVGCHSRKRPWPPR